MSEAGARGELTLQTIAMPADTNANGDIFGGWLMAQMDLGSGVLARARARGRVATVAVEAMAFHRPVRVGDLVSILVDGDEDELRQAGPAGATGMRAVLAALAVLAGPAAAASEFPTLFDVVGVGSGDALNVRAAPGAGAEIVGGLGADSKGVEVVRLDSSGRWGQVNSGERTGWVAMRYLAERAGVWRGGSLPAGLACFGTEPFWSLEPREGRVVFSTPDAQEQSMELVAALDTGIAGDRRRALIAEGAPGRVTATIAPAACNDGMSDRAYGLSVTVVREGSGGAELLTGCCSLGR